MVVIINNDNNNNTNNRWLVQFFIACRYVIRCFILMFQNNNKEISHINFYYL